MLMEKHGKRWNLYAFLFLQFTLFNNRFVFSSLLFLKIFVERSPTDRIFVSFCPYVIQLRECRPENLGKWDVLFKNHIQMKFPKTKK